MTGEETGAKVSNKSHSEPTNKIGQKERSGHAFAAIWRSTVIYIKIKGTNGSPRRTCIPLVFYESKARIQDIKYQYKQNKQHDACHAPEQS